MENRLILAIDNSLDFLSIALAKEEDILEERKIKGREPPSKIIGEEVLQILKKREIEPNDLNILLCTTGPGSFTGIRVALAFLKGLKVGLGIPLVGVSTLDCLAFFFAFMQGFYILPAIDAKKGEVFCALYFSDGKTLERLTPYESKKPQEIKEMIKGRCLVVGSGIKLLKDKIKNCEVMFSECFYSYVPMSALLSLGLKRLNLAEDNVLPIYGRRSEAEIKFGLQLT